MLRTLIGANPFLGNILNESYTRGVQGSLTANICRPLSDKTESGSVEPTRNHEDEKGISFVIPNMISLYSAEPLLRAAIRSRIPVHLVGRQNVRHLAAEILGTDHLNQVAIEPIEQGTRWVRTFHRGLLEMLTPLDFSTAYSVRRQLNFATRSPGRRLVSRVLLRLPKPDRRNVNRAASMPVRLLLRNPFPTRQIIVVSFFDLPHLLCARDQEVTVLLESWDHPYKRPIGHVAQNIIPWNRDLARDWMSHQGRARVIDGFPFKLRFAIERRGASPQGASISSLTKLMYAASTSALTDVPRWYEEELRLIEDIAAAAVCAGVELVVKPKPNGSPRDFESLARKWQNVKIGKVGEVQATSDYYLDDEYNQVRFDETLKADLVISLLTTFALDAAALGAPVLQLDLRQSRSYPALAEASCQYHIARYLLRRKDLTLQVGVGSALEPVLGFLQNPDSRPNQFSAYLRKWVGGLEGSSASAERIIASVSPGDKDGRLERASNSS
jgi:hypothetical protein